MNHPKVASFTADVAESLGLPPAFTAFVLSSEKPECMHYRCDAASAGWTPYVPDDVTAAFPLWSCNADQTVLMVAPGSAEYCHTCHEDSDIERIARTPAGLLANLFIDLYEDDVPIEDLECAARFAGFDQLLPTIDFAQREGDDFRNWHERKQNFIANIDAHGI